MTATILRSFAGSPLIAAAVAALITASPTLYEKLWEVRNDTGGKSRTAIEEQVRAWQRNPTCGQAENDWHPGLGGTQVDALICNHTGDVLVSTKVPSGRISQYFVPVEIAAGLAGEAKLAGLFGSPAHASLPRLTPVPAARRPAGAQLSQVLCQTQPDARTVVRHLKLANGECVDVYIDVYAGGKEIKRVPVPCRPAC